MSCAGFALMFAPVGSRHTVAEGEHLALIADRYGFSSVDPIVGHPDNAPLYRDRQPGVLATGEVLVIPEQSPATFTVASGATHTFCKKILRVNARLILQALGGRPEEGLRCSIACDGKRSEVTTGPDGLVEFPIAPSTNEATIKIGSAADGGKETTLELAIGGIGPTSDADSAMLRLQNLGYYRPGFPEEDENERRTAIEEFQLENGLKVTGALDKATCSQLEAIYGC